MATWQIILLLIAGFAVAVWLVFDFLIDARDIIAPDSADADRIDRALGKDTPAGRAAIKQRFGPNRHWLDSLTALGGMLGIALTWWIFS